MEIALTVLLLVMLLMSLFAVRSTWVFKRRQELIDWHFSRDHPQRFRSIPNFDQVYGSYDDWMRRWWSWNPVTLAGGIEGVSKWSDITNELKENTS